MGRYEEDLLEEVGSRKMAAAARRGHRCFFACLSPRGFALRLSAVPMERYAFADGGSSRAAGDRCSPGFRGTSSDRARMKVRCLAA